MVPSPWRTPPCPSRSDRRTAQCRGRSSTGHGAHAARHCQFADPQDLPSTHQILPTHPPRASVTRHCLESTESEPGKRKIARQVNSKCESPDDQGWTNQREESKVLATNP